MTMTLRRR
jgi:phosphopantothenoylcysteine synthetase/decarboxylase